MNALTHMADCRDVMPRASLKMPSADVLDRAYHDDLLQELIDTGLAVGDRLYRMDDAEAAFCSSDTYREYADAAVDADPAKQIA